MLKAKSPWPHPLRGGALALGWAFFFLILGHEFFRQLLRHDFFCDLDILLQAAHRMAAGEGIYRLGDPNEHTKLPWVTVLTLPLIHLPRQALYQVWALATLLSFAWLLLKQLKQRWDSGWTLLIAFGVLKYLINEFRLGQTNVFIMSLLMSAISGRDGWARGIPLALAIGLKPTQLIFAAYFAGARRWRSLGGAALTGLGLFLICVPLLGWQNSWHMHLEWLSFIRASGAKHLLTYDNQSLITLLAFAWPSVVAYGWVFTIAQLPPGFLLGARQVQGHPLAAFAFCAWLSILLSPMSWPQNFVALLPLLCIYTDLLRRNMRWPHWIGFALYFLVTQVANYDTLGFALFNLTMHWRFLTWGSCALALGAYLALRRSRERVSVSL